MALFRQHRKSGLQKYLNRVSWLNADNRKLISRFFYVCVIILVLLLLSSFLVWRFEYAGSSSSSIRTFWEGIWWAVVTVTTVGYGDKVPVTPYGRIVGIMLIGTGFTLLSVFTGLVASLFVEDRLKGAKGLKQIKTHGHIVICGWNNTAESLLKALVEKGETEIEVCLITSQSQEFFESIESQYSSIQMRFVRGEATNEDVLKRASISTAAQVIILADQSLERHTADDRSIIIANSVHYLVGKNKVTVQLINPENRNLLERVGISNIIIFDDLGGYLLANNISENCSLNIYSQLLKSTQTQIQTCPIAPEFIGKTYGAVFDMIYKEEKRLLIGLMTKESELELDSIFSDNSSAIDQFIKNTLANSKRSKSENKANIRWNPPRDCIIQESDHAILI